MLADEERDVAGSFDFPLRRALTSPRIWLLAVVYFGVAYGLYALAFFLPSIISDFKKTFDVHLSIVQVGLISAVPYTLAAIAMYLWSRHADRQNEHVWHVAIPMGAGRLGYSGRTVSALPPAAGDDPGLRRRNGSVQRDPPSFWRFRRSSSPVPPQRAGSG